MPQSNYSRNQNYNGNRNGNAASVIMPLFKAEELNESNYVDLAEKVIKAHDQSRDKITTSQLRSLFSLMTEMREIIRVRPEKVMDEMLVSRIQYIKMRFVYAAGRGEKGVPDFMKQSALIECLNSVKDSSKRFELVCKYMEALVAYHKYYINK